MSYRIVYGQKMQIYGTSTKRNTRQYKKWIVAIVLVASLVSIFASSKLRRMLLPGNPQITEAAITQLADDIRNGESFSDAVTVFCKEILENA